MTGLGTASGALREVSRAAWPEPGDAGPPPPIRGFVASPFAPLVAAAADRCLRRRTGAAAAGHTAVVLVSAYGDQATAAAVVAEVDRGRRVSPMYFFQAVPNSVLGHVAAEWALTGPVVCLSPAGDPLAEGRSVAEGLFADGDAAEALVITVEHGVDPAEPAGATAVLLAPGRARTPDSATAPDSARTPDRATAPDSATAPAGAGRRDDAGPRDDRPPGGGGQGGVT